MKKKIAALLVFVMVLAVVVPVMLMMFVLATPVMAAYRTGSAAGDAAAYGAGGAIVGSGAYAAVMCFFGVACPPAAIACAAVVGGAYLGWYGATDSDKTIKKDIVNVVIASGAGYKAGLEIVNLMGMGAKAAGAALQAAY